MRNFVAWLVLLTTPLAAQTFDDAINKGDVFYNAGNYPEAIRYFTQAIELDKKNVKGYWYRADAYRQNQQYTESVADYSKALEFDPQSVKFLTRRGDCYYNLNQFQLALNDYTRGLDLDKANATLWLYRGDCYAKLGDSNNACDDYQQAFELGNKSAKVQARQIDCDWVRALSKPCPSGEALINRMEVEPFTGAVVVGRGLTFERFEALVLKSEKTITGPEYAMDEEFNFRISKPKNFCADEDDDVYFGIGIKLREGTKELISLPNIYDGQEQGVPEESLKSLTCTVDFRSPMEPGKKYQLDIRYFDLRGNGEVTVAMPITLASSTRTNANTFRTESSLGPGIRSASVGIEPVRLECRLKGRKELLKNYTLYRNAVYLTTVVTKAALPKNISVSQRLILQDGSWLNEKPAKATINQNILVFEINTVGVKPGNYKLLTRIVDTESTNTISLVMPIVVR